jgi:AmmeMemoRadiSam system protein A
VSTPLDEAARDRLLRLARAALQQRLRSDGALDRELARGEPTPALRESRGAFVSLKRPGPGGSESIRGCIGTMVPRRPLYESVIEMAGKAAFEDPRFDPMVADELRDVRIEISVLTPLRSVASPEAIEIGRHGIQLRRGTAGAVFLPQVATEYGWSRETLLRQLSLKAGLAEEAWRAAELSVFEAEVFGEPIPSD